MAAERDRHWFLWRATGAQTTCGEDARASDIGRIDATRTTCLACLDLLVEESRRELAEMLALRDRRRAELETAQGAGAAAGGGSG